MEKIAVIGLGCLFPGASSPEAFWDALLARQDFKSEATVEQMGVDPALLFHPSKGTPDKMYSTRGGYIRDFQFDPSEYADGDFLATLDRIYHWSLHVARQALEDSGYLNNAAALLNAGVIMGNLSFPTRASHYLINPIYWEALNAPLRDLLQRKGFSLPAYPIDENAAPHNIAISGYPAALVAQTFGLGAINFCLDAACASSLYSVKLACQQLLARKADLMLAGAVSCPDPYNINMGFSIFQAYPAQGEHSRPLDKSSKGLVAAEGAGMFVLKRYSDALRDGDQVYATILGAGWSNDGRGKHFLTPKSEGQVIAFERAYAEASISPAEIQYIECHATGTPLGDVTELQSIDRFFQPYNTHLDIGSVKSNCGHLLTAAGMASMLKVILAMQHNVIPATIDVTDPQSTGNVNVRVVNESIEWSAGRKIAAVDAFGFGGVNAHLILERDTAAPDGDPVPYSQEKVAIVGMEAFFGRYRDLAAFEQAIYAGAQGFGDLPASRWKGIEAERDLLERYGLEAAPQGAYIEDFEIDFLGFRIPPAPEDQPVPQQLLMLKVADGALKDAHIQAGSNVAVIIAMGAELALHQFRGRVDLTWQIKTALEREGVSLSDTERAELETLAKESFHNWPQVNQYISFIGNIIASRVSAAWDFSGPSFTLSAEENSTFKALEVARTMLASGEVEAVLVGAVDLAGGVENVLLRQRLFPSKTNAEGTLSFGETEAGWRIGEGAGAVVLKRHDHAQRDQDRIYAVIDAISMAQMGRQPSAEAVTFAVQQALYEAQAYPQDIGYVEAFASGHAAEDSAEIKGLVAAYQNPDLLTALGSVKATIGHSYTASGIAALIKTALALYHRYLPAVPKWYEPADPDAWEDSAFYFPTESRAWFLAQDVSLRRAAINGLGMDGTHAHVILSEEPTYREPVYGAREALTLLVLPAENADDLLHQLATLDTALQNTSNLSLLASQTHQNYLQRADAPYTLALVGASRDDLRRELALARTGIPAAFEKHGDWESPNGSSFSANPQGTQGKVAFVYPGAFNSYVGLGRDVFHLFNDLHEHFATITADAGNLIAARYLYPRRRRALTKSDVEALQVGLQADAATMIESGMSFSLLYTLLLRDYFGLQPHAAFGYSMGEATMMWAMGVWHDADVASEMLHGSPVFTERLVGAMTAASDYLGVPPTPDFWSTYVLSCSAAKIQPLIQQMPRVFLTHINTPNEVVISGYTEDCQRLLEQLGCPYIKAPFSAVIHNPAMRSEYDEIARLHTLPTTPVDQVDFYTASTYDRTAIDEYTVAQDIAAATCQQVDFPRLVQRVYDDGARIFIELGARSTCTRWISDILKGQPFVALSMNRTGQPDHVTLIKVLAKLVSHRAPLDVSLLYAPLPTEEKKSLVKTIQLGGKRLRDVILTPPNREKFGKFALMPEPITPKLPSNGQTEPDDLFQQAIPDTGLASRGHITFLNTSQSALRQIAETVKLHMQMVNAAQIDEPAQIVRESPRPSPTPPSNAKSALVPVKPVSAGMVWDEAALLEFAEGEIANVFGKEYGVIDTYARRVRLPLPPYLLVTRVTKIDAKIGEYKPSSMTTEYDIPYDAWYSVDGQIPWAVAVESGQCDLLLISYIGIDFENKGVQVYRLLDCTLTFIEDLPKEGETLRYDISINSYARSGDNLLFFFSYNCYVGDTLVLTMRGGCAGFFSDSDLEAGKGVIFTNEELEARRNAVKQHFEPLLYCDKRAFSRDEMLRLTTGDVAGVFGAHYDQGDLNPSLRLPAEAMLMIDEIRSLDPSGGPWGLGEIVGVKYLDPDHWYFPCHFKDDQVMAGSLMAEGGVQLMQFYLLHLGLQTQTIDARFQPIPHLPQVVRCRGQVTPTKGELIYKMEITEIGLYPSPYAKANLDIILNGKVVVNFKDLGLQLAEKAESPLRPKGIVVAKDALYDERHIEEFALGSIAACFGEEYRIYENRRTPRTPNTDLKLINRVVEINAERLDFKPFSSLVTEYDVPADAWFTRKNSAPVTPYSILMEIALQPCGFLSAWLGSTLPYPDSDFYFRNLDGTGTLLRDVDLRGRTITNRVRLLSSTSIQGIIIQKFDYELSLDGDPFYVGTAAFGYFSPEALANQVGLDQGKVIPPLHEQNRLPVQRIDLAQSRVLYDVNPDKPFYRLAGGQLEFLDTVLLAERYVYAEKRIDPSDWFYVCHFYQDPVMPGSLGVEAILEAMQVYALHNGIGKQFRSPRFDHVLNHEIVWKYRGQITPRNDKMYLEVKITSVDTTAAEIVITGDASLWRDNMRIYELKGIALRIAETRPGR